MCLSLSVLQPRHKGCSAYLWHEGEGALTANEFASSVTYSFADNPWFSKNILYSNGSTYQNRQSTLSKALLHFAVTENVEVEQNIKERATHKWRLTLSMVVLKGISRTLQSTFLLTTWTKSRWHAPIYFLSKSSSCTTISLKIWGQGSSVGRARDSWWGGPGFDTGCVRLLSTGWVSVTVSIMWPAETEVMVSQLCLMCGST